MYVLHNGDLIGCCIQSNQNPLNKEPVGSGNVFCLVITDPIIVPFISDSICVFNTSTS